MNKVKDMSWFLKREPTNPNWLTLGRRETLNSPHADDDWGWYSVDLAANRAILGQNRLANEYHRPEPDLNAERWRIWGPVVGPVLAGKCKKIRRAHCV